MKQLTAREKNLGVVVLTICLLSGWWYLARVLDKQTATLEAQALDAEAQIRTANGALQALQSAGMGTPAAVAAGPVIRQSKLTMTLLKELTLPKETENLKFVSVTGGGAGAFMLSVEGRFAEMMRFLSYLERTDSRFSVGNVQLGKSAEAADAAGKPQDFRIRGSIQIALKG